jgi:biopolymer transport protein ExbB/TolQ
MLIERLMKLALLGSEWVLYLLLVLSVLSFATMVERTVYFLRRRVDIDQLRNQIVSALEEHKLEELATALDTQPSIQARIVRVALRWLHGGADALSDAVASELARIRAELERGSNLLGTLGNNAPFVGLFGTVLGVIIAFAALGDSGGNTDAMGGVMAGIAEALVATGVGLFVALPAVVAYNLIQKKIGDIETDAQALVTLVSAYAKGDPDLVEKAKGLREERANVAHLPVGEEREHRSGESLISRKDSGSSPRKDKATQERSR